MRELFDAIVIGGGQAGLATGYHLRGRGLRFVILESGARIGESWRRRWDSLRVFTPAKYSGLPGMPFPAPPRSLPTKDEVANYLEAYARKMDLPVRTGLRVERLVRANGGGGFIVHAGDLHLEAPQVVVATGAYHEPRIPEFARELSPQIRQFHSSTYRNRSQLQPGGVLVVGGGNSGGEIAFDAVREHPTWLVGRDTGQMPFAIDSLVAKMVDPLIWFLANHVMTTATPIGRRAGPSLRSQGHPLERVRATDLTAAGVTRIHERVVAVRDGLPLLADDRALDVANVVWCTGFRHEYPWIELPVVGDDGWPMHERGVVRTAPGLYFVGVPFQYSMASSLIGGVGRDAAYVVDRVATMKTTTAHRDIPHTSGTDAM